GSGVGKRVALHQTSLRLVRNATPFAPTHVVLGLENLARVAYGTDLTEQRLSASSSMMLPRRPGSTESVRGPEP
ncbi:MAG: hypothetical protein L0K63_12675, partial [Yaniella sp.]|nr:hypothetical protein [Yaniella sp.]